MQYVQAKEFNDKLDILATAHMSKLCFDTFSISPSINFGNGFFLNTGK